MSSPAKPLQPPPEPKNLTPFARKYGRITDEPGEKALFRYIYSRGKSGYTPTDSIFSVELDARKDWHINEVEHLQRFLFHGFIARDFLELGVYPSLQEPDISLTNPIHPLLDLPLWETTQAPDRLKRPPLNVVCDGPAYKHLQRHKGRWLADNPIVWTILEPVLRLASLMLTKAVSTVFVDAFLCGQFKPIPDHLDTRPDHLKASQGHLQSFHPREAHLIGNQTAQDAFAYFADLFKQKAQWGIVQGGIDPADRTKPFGIYSGVTLPEFEGDKPTDPVKGLSIQICTQMLMPLLRNDLLHGEKMALRFAAAETIMHEIMHTMNCLLVGTPSFPHLVRTEPYFDNNIFSEMGYAYTLETVGGRIMPLRVHNADDPQNSCPGYTLVNHPNSHTGWMMPTIVDQNTILGGRGSITTDIKYQPIHNSWYPLIHNEDFWDVGLKRYGVSILKPRTAGTTITHTNAFVKGQGEGYRNTALQIDKNPRQFVPEFWESIWTQIPKTPDDSHLWSLTPEQLRALELSDLMFKEESLAATSEFNYHRMKTVAGEIRSLLEQARTSQSVVAATRPDQLDAQLGEIYNELGVRIRSETVHLQNQCIGVLLAGITVVWKSATGQWYFDFLVKTNRRLRQTLSEILEWASDRRFLRKLELIEDIYAGASFTGGLLCTQRDFFTRSSTGIDLQKYLQVMQDELQKFNQAMVERDWNASTTRRATWDELYTPMDKEIEKKLKGEYMATANRIKFSSECLIGATTGADDLDNLFKNTGFELCCQIGDAQQTSYGLNQIVGQILIYRNREQDHTQELRDLRNQLMEVRVKLNLPRFSFKRYGIAAWGNDIDANELARRKIDLSTGRGPVPDNEREIQLDCEQWTDTLDVMIYNSLNPGQKRDVDTFLPKLEYSGVEEQGRTKKLRESMIFCC